MAIVDDTSEEETASDIEDLLAALNVDTETSAEDVGGLERL